MAVAAPRAPRAGAATRNALLRHPGGWALLGGSAAFVLALWLGNAAPSAQPPSAPGAGTAHAPAGDWNAYGATHRGTRFAAHTQINRDNVAQLEPAWTYRTRVAGTFKATPIQVRDTLYLCTGQNLLVALNADTGEERWRFDPRLESPRFGFWDTCRGVTYYRAPAERPSAVCPERIVTATTDARLIAVNATTGAPCGDFGQNGEINLLTGLGEVKPGFYYVTSPPALARGTLVLGGWVVDNQETGEPSGVVRGFDPITGSLRWAWDMGRADRTGEPPAGEYYTRGTPNVWSLISADDELGLVYLPTGNATPDYYGGHRSAVMDRYASSIVALDSTTGRVRWHFQTTHHDVWDYDVPSQPSLVDLDVDGVPRKAVIVPTKRAQLYLLDRLTGEPLAAVEERPVPQTDVPEETTHPTQPFSIGMPSFAHPRLREADMWGITPLDQAACRLKFRRLRYEGPMTPPSVGGSLQYPGIAGGMNWGSVAVDEVNRLMVVSSLHMPFEVTLIPRAEATPDRRHYALGGLQSGTPYAARSFPFLSPIFTPCLRPPYGEMGVVDLNTRELLWRRPVGTARDQGPLGVASRLPLPMGMFYRAGAIVTGGGVIFNGGVMDRRLRALDLLTGKELWSTGLPRSAEATPMSYVSPATGKQYVVLAVAGDDGAPLDPETAEHGAGNITEDAPGGYVMAWALPD